MSGRSVNKTRVDYEPNRLYVSSEMSLANLGEKLKDLVPYSSGGDI